ncbi:hypothetical protein [Anaerotruncus rubiinfantis]|uniref:hypothetical protein n=1 Tax=Anaerotruncus rubiinfantis TaxID=1720200 RepID=UPI00189B0244|nr:hypothetical protein [Anaerotruncus rubiinfantis]
MDEKMLLESIKNMLEAQTADIKGEINRLDEKIDVLSAKMDTNFSDTRSELVEAIEAVGNKVDALERSIKDVETVTARNTFELQLIKGKA